MENTKPKRAPQQGDKYILRFPEGMRERIAEAAKANNRSMNAEILARIEASFEAQEDARVAVAPILDKLDQLTWLLQQQKQDGKPKKT